MNTTTKTTETETETTAAAAFAAFAEDFFTGVLARMDDNTADPWDLWLMGEGPAPTSTVGR